MGFTRTELPTNQAVRKRMVRSMSPCTLRDNDELIKKSSSNLLNKAPVFGSDYRPNQRGHEFRLHRFGPVSFPYLR
jgi:hypothetical protein